MKELTLEITNRCSLNCILCSTIAGPKGDIFLSLNKIEEIIDKYEDFNVVRLSGGEPFEHPKLNKICKLIKSKNKKVKILSSGIFYDYSLPLGWLKDMDKNIDEVIFSYHGREKIHESITNPEKKKKEYTNLLYASIDKVTILKIPYSFETVVIKKNFNRLEEIAKMMSLFAFHKWFNTTRLRADELTDTRWHLLKFVKQGRGLENSDLALSYKESKKIPLIAEKLMDKYPALIITCSNSFENKKCDCGSKKAVYTCYNEEIPCSALKNSIYRGRFSCRFRN
ncbi:MAG: radical SAM protein [Candidatus Nanoarchaeia archaeon]|nr:radical SAM protein [Candidatus Nanoarchaeia archaeon]MDD5740865.1 radical SAM protein [Candidatus Nanoarchaeia archaeon]